MAKPKTRRKKKGGEKTPAKSIEQLRKEAIAQADRNIARLEAEEHGRKAKPGGGKNTRKPLKDKGGKLSILEAAFKVLKEAKKPMRCGDVMKIMLDKGLWSTNGKTPSATLYSAILREMQVKGKDTRFKKVERGLFALAGKVA